MTDSEKNPGYEKKDVSVNKVVLWGVIGVTLLIVFIVFVMDFFVATKEKLVYERQLKPESVEIRELRAREAEILNSYKTIDSAKGIYRIPIERAMQLMADEAYLERRGQSGK